MKKSLLLTAIGLSTIISFNNVQAEDNRTEENIGFGTGLVIGAIAGGPIGAIIGAASGVWLGDKVNEAEKVEPLTEKIAQHRVHLDSLEESLAEQSHFLDQANLLLAENEATQMKVAQNKNLMTGLQIDLMFRTNSSQLETGAVEKIAPLVLMLEQFPQLQLQLTGHGDVLGTDAANEVVSLDRTVAVKQSFINAGIDEQRIHLISSGRSQAEASLEDTDGRALERRVRIRFMHTESKGVFALK